MRLLWLFSRFLALNLSFGAPETYAALLFAGGEDVDFSCNGSGSCDISTNTDAFRVAWAREGYRVAGSAGDPPVNRFATPTFTASSALCIHAQYCKLTSVVCATKTNSNVQVLRIFDRSGNPELVVCGTGTAGEVKVSSRNASGTFTDLVTCPSAINSALTQIDISINYGATGEIKFYNNGAQVCSYSGDVTNGDSATTLNQLEFSPARSDGYGVWSEVIVATTDTRAMARFSAYTVGNGNTTDFSGTDVCSSIWHATAFNDSKYGYSDAANVSHACTINGTVPPGAYSVVGLVMSARVLVGSTGPQHFDFLTRVNGTDYPSSDFAPLPSFSNIGNYIQTTNPATGNPWAVSDFAATGFNVGEKTKP